MIYTNFREAYPILIADLLKYGEEVSPRGMLTYELQGYGFVIEDPTDVLITRPGWSDPFAAAEAAQLIGGVSYPDKLKIINPTMERFFEERDGRTHQHGAYGPRIREALPKAVEALRADPNSRQALLTIWNSATDYAVSADIPCTVSIQFTIRNNRLNMQVLMRSNDIWWGTPYDVFQFTQLQLTVARCLGIEPGRYFHTANSLHAYDRDLQVLGDMRVSPKREFHPLGFGDGSFNIDYAMHVAAKVWPGELLAKGGWITESESWYLDQLAYVSPRGVE